MVKLPLPFNWQGTKVSMRGVILPLLERFERALYVEPFGGAGGLFFGKPQEPAEVFNDSNGLIINLFKTIRDPSARWQLLCLLEISPSSRALYYDLEPLLRAYLRDLDEFRQLKEERRLGKYTDEVAAAFAFFYVQNNGFGGNALHRSYGGGQTGAQAGGTARRYSEKLRRLADYVARLETVELECIDALECLQKYDAKDTLFFIDPPYICESSRDYKSGWNKEKDAALVDVLRHLKGRYVLTVYDAPIYRQLLTSGDVQQYKHEKTTTLSSNAGFSAMKEESIYYKGATRAGWLF